MLNEITKKEREGYRESIKDQIRIEKERLKYYHRKKECIEGVILHMQNQLQELSEALVE
jgi:hypothetical protein